MSISHKKHSQNKHRKALKRKNKKYSAPVTMASQLAKHAKAYDAALHDGTVNAPLIADTTTIQL